MAKKELSELGLDKVIHERARLVILARLASGFERETGFTELRDELGFTAGNLSVQLKNLEEAGYVAISKSYRDNKPWTGVSLTKQGKKALEAYVSDMEDIVSRLRAAK